AAWQIVVEDDEQSHRHLVATAEGFWQPDQTELTGPFVARYFAEMPAMAQRRTPQVVYQVAALAFPIYAVAPQTVAAAEDLLARSDLSPLLRRVVVDGTDEIR